VVHARPHEQIHAQARGAGLGEDGLAVGGRRGETGRRSRNTSRDGIFQLLGKAFPSEQRFVLHYGISDAQYSPGTRPPASLTAPSPPAPPTAHTAAPPRPVQR